MSKMKTRNSQREKKRRKSANSLATSVRAYGRERGPALSSSRGPAGGASGTVQAATYTAMSNRRFNEPPAHVASVD